MIQDDKHEAKAPVTSPIEQVMEGVTSAPVQKRRVGFLKGLKIPDDFDSMFEEEIIEMFEGTYSSDL